jgi:soluble cytochrome b562
MSEADQVQAEYEKDTKGKKKGELKEVPEVKFEELTDSVIEGIQEKLKRSNVGELKKLTTAADTASDKAASVKDFENYFRPFQEKRTLLWNELGKVNQFDLPINVNAGKPEVPANYTKTITLYYNSASNEQLEKIDRLRGKSSDLDRIERLSNMPIAELEKKGLKIPSNYFTISTEAAQAKEDLMILRIVSLCGIDVDTAKKIKGIADSRSFSDILDSWEYRCRTGYPNSKSEGTPSTSVSGYQ